MLWTLENIDWGIEGAASITVPDGVKRKYPLLGLVVVVGVLIWATNWYGSANEQLAARAVIVVAGFAIGYIMRSSRLCFARAFRDPSLPVKAR
ncbi:MAG: hypothetical protein IPP88_18890 [Betaproteobacteria bacterium]|nr:hypothetical protein [Betaproteobacteria bacterium]